MVSEANLISQLEDRVKGLEERRLPARLERCSADFPHVGQMNYALGRYTCPCGQVYIKDGQGGLRDA